MLSGGSRTGILAVPVISVPEILRCRPILLSSFGTPISAPDDDDEKERGRWDKRNFDVPLMHADPLVALKSKITGSLYTLLLIMALV